MRFEYGVRVTDVDFSTGEDGTRRVRRLHLERDGQPGTLELGPGDYAFLTLGSMTADAAYGSDDHAPELVRDKRDGAWRLWGYGLFVDREGDFVGKPMARATGREILTELLGHLGMTDIEEEVAATTTVVPVTMPYVTSQFAPRTVHDRPPVVPRGAANFAFLGQFTEIPEDVVFTVEYSVRGAMHAVHGLLGLDKEIPGIHHAAAGPKTALTVLRAALA